MVKINELFIAIAGSPFRKCFRRTSGNTFAATNGLF